MLAFGVVGLCRGASVQREAEGWVVEGGATKVCFDDSLGAIRSVQSGTNSAVTWRSGEFGLWRITFSDGGMAQAADFSRSGFTGRVEIAPAPHGNELVLRYRSDDFDLTVRAIAQADGVDLVADVTPAKRTILDVELPSRLRFAPDSVRRFIFPGRGNMSVGCSFNAAFFGRQSAERPAGWRYETTGPDAYRALAGDYLQARAVDDPPVPLHVTDAGRRWFDTTTVRSVEGRLAAVNRVTMPRPDVSVFVDATNGPYFTAQTLGAGHFWRLSGARQEDQITTDLAMVSGVLSRLISDASGSRRRVGLLDVYAGPGGGSWNKLSLQAWRDVWQKLARRFGTKADLIRLQGLGDLGRAISSGEYLAILNPYGEALPVPSKSALREAVSNVEAYVRAGGNWFEVGGCPFHYALVPEPYLAYGGPRPNLFADFALLETAADSVAMFGIQPRTGNPWAASSHDGSLFVPGRLQCGGDEAGGYLDRGFATFVAAGSRWRSPVTRIVCGTTPESALDVYAAANQLGPRLEQKLPVSVLQKLRESVLVYVDGNAREKLETLPRLPSPVLLHFADYLKGGFDKEYPDHLPPNESFGTADELRAFIAAGHAAGDLVMPYTNPTWWCDHPRGPTFVRAGDAPLLRNAKMETVRETYGANGGFTICPWHPDVRAANRMIVDQFTKEYPVDILFQDQLGARSWQRDYNAASPSPYAYAHGVAAKGREDARRIPLATEDGNDLVVDCEAMFCGMTWGLVPFAPAPAWRKLMREEVPPATWEIYPLAQHLAHERVALYHHDLGAFVTSRETLTWSLALGYGLSFRVPKPVGFTPKQQEWLKWLSRVQKSVVARCVGHRMRAFRHSRSQGTPLDDDGVVTARYGDVDVMANLGASPRMLDGHVLPPNGFHASGPGVVAGEVMAGDHIAGYVAEWAGNPSRSDLWVFARPGGRVAVPVWTEGLNEREVRLENGAAIGRSIEQGMVILNMPAMAQEGEAFERLVHVVLTPR